MNLRHDAWRLRSGLATGLALTSLIAPVTASAHGPHSCSHVARHATCLVHSHRVKSHRLHAAHKAKAARAKHHARKMKASLTTSTTKTTTKTVATLVTNPAAYPT